MANDRIINNMRFSGTYEPGRIPRGEECELCQRCEPPPEIQSFFDLVVAVGDELSHMLNRSLLSEEIEEAIIQRCGKFPPTHEQAIELLQKIREVKKRSAPQRGRPSGET
jgi:hypothetical protein